MLHLIPDDGAPHAPTTECGCGVRVIRFRRADGTVRRAYAHGLDLSDVEVTALQWHTFQLRPDACGWSEVDTDLVPMPGDMPPGAAPIPELEGT